MMRVVAIVQHLLCQACLSDGLLNHALPFMISQDDRDQCIQHLGQPEDDPALQLVEGLAPAVPEEGRPMPLASHQHVVQLQVMDGQRDERDPQRLTHGGQLPGRLQVRLLGAPQWGIHRVVVHLHGGQHQDEGIVSFPLELLDDPDRSPVDWNRPWPHAWPPSGLVLHKHGSVGLSLIRSSLFFRPLYSRDQ
jgi:hypothetical protein